ncbi:MAG: glycosyltransferase [Nitrospinae bacterium]|nr:glycosyltransferase [Nitrospinota bacterium]
MTELAISAVIPVYNEVESLPILVQRLLPALAAIGPYEVIFINDGSDDGSAEKLDGISRANPGMVKVIHLRANCGKSLALQAGFREAKGRLTLMMDADLQDQPEEIHKLIRHMDENRLDGVTGWKATRHDPIGKTAPSRFFNWVMRRFSGLEIHDFNCGLKIFKRECLQDVSLYGQLHRFILILVANMGFRVGEVPVEHAPRQFGYSKFGAKRIFSGAVDFLTVFFITRYLHSPLYFFGFYGVALILVSMVTGAYFILMHFYSLAMGLPLWHLANHPLWILSPILFLLGVIMLFFGLIGELITYHMMGGAHHLKFIAGKTGFAAEKDDARSS